MNWFSLYFLPFLGNTTEKTEVTVIPSLKDTCITYLKRNVKKLELFLNHFFNGSLSMLLDTKLLMQVLLSAVHSLSVDTLRHLEAALPMLALETESEEIWRRFVVKHYNVREITSPFPIMVAEVTKLVETWDSAPSATKQNILDKLCCVPFSDELASQTSVALKVNAIRKDSTLPSSLTKSAGELTAKWKQAFKKQRELKAQGSPADHNNEGITGNAGLDSVNLLTWRQLYGYYEEKERSMVEKGAKRFSELSNTIRDKRKTTVSATNNNLSKHKKQRLEMAISDSNRSGSRARASTAKSTMFRTSNGTPIGKSFLQSVKSTKGHSAVDLMQARSLQSTKKVAVVTTSSGGVMQIPKWAVAKNKRV